MDKETKTMFEILHENKDKVRTQKIIKKQLIEDNKKIAQQQRKAIVTGIVLAIMLILSLIAIGYSNEKFIKDCTKGGLSENVCMSAL